MSGAQRPFTPGTSSWTQAGSSSKTAPLRVQVRRSVDVRQWMKPGGCPALLVVQKTCAVAPSTTTVGSWTGLISPVRGSPGAVGGAPETAGGTLGAHPARVATRSVTPATRDGGGSPVT